MVLSETDSFANEEIVPSDIAEPGETVQESADGPTPENAGETAETTAVSAADDADPSGHAENETKEDEIAEKAAAAEEPAALEDAAAPEESVPASAEDEQREETAAPEAYDLRDNVFFALEEDVEEIVSEPEEIPAASPRKIFSAKKFSLKEKKKNAIAEEKDDTEAAAETATAPVPESPSVAGKELPDVPESEQENTEPADDAFAPVSSVEAELPVLEKSAEEGAADAEPETEPEAETETQEAVPQTMDERLALLGESVTDKHSKERSGVRKFTVPETIHTLKDLFANGEGRKQVKFLGVPVNFLGIGIVVLFLIDMIALNMASYKIIYWMIERILKSNGVEALRLSGDAFSRMFVGISYVASFLIGGLVVLFMARVAERLIRELSFSESASLIMGIVGVLAFVFLIGAIVSAAVSGNLLSVSVYRWGGPLLTYAGGLLFLMLSRISLRIDY